MEDNTLSEQAASGRSTPAVSQSGVSINWSEYELPLHVDRASDVPRSSRTAQARSFSSVIGPISVGKRLLSRDGEVLVQDDDNDADDDASLPSITDLRENRFLGPVQNWRAFTREERNVWKAFEIERSRDLAAHLFNAFALQKRAERISQQQQQQQRLFVSKPNDIAPAATGSKSPLLTSGGAQVEEEIAFTPGQYWTAWPMPASIVPREGEDMQRNADDRFTISALPDGRPSANLEHYLMSKMLKVAKERWNSRQWERAEIDNATGKDPFKQSQGAQGDEHNESQPDVSTHCESFGTQLTATSFEADTDTVDEDLSDYPETKREGTLTSTESTLRPAIQTDDEVSYRILRPTARHILTRVDDLLLALHRARASYMGNDYDREKTSKRKRKCHVTEKDNANQGIDKEPAEMERSNSVPEQDGGPIIKQNVASRPRKRRARAKSAQNKNLALEGEDLRPLSDSEREFTPAELSSSASDLEDSPLPEHTKHTHLDAGEMGRESSPASQSNLGNSTIRSRADRIGLRDWSDILGTAIITGFPKDAVDRASARCARLFGEDMAFRTFETGRIRKLRQSAVIENNEEEEEEEGDAKAPVFEYTDEPFDASELGMWKWRRQQMGKRRQKFDPRPASHGRKERALANTEESRPTLSFTSLSGVKPIVKKVPEHKLMCPVAGCQRARRGNGFARLWNLNQHISKMHPDLAPLDQGQRSQRMWTRSTSTGVG
ncbi:hypothetical protein KEM54_002722 [Ascosphaera aggregata]|nr:hypothetical protein KEM54_002722 [Ascosphaera aggregata]